ncbi:thiamine phosphate synthase [uncultured Legionella sp.]|uniref:thiamine phosphate synthase n=1 Tax=uncultured Legionella sp. TaxID=210934 RepID=UPI0026065CA4|nr:thiamine phosphate synthase [uncultured Legionella sp.]
MNTDFYKLILVTHRQNIPLSQYLNFIKECISSGVTSVQLREKNGDAAFKLEFAQHLKQILSPFNIPLLINDDTALAQQVNAEGVHLGQTDTAPTKARELLGAGKFIGLSIESEHDLVQANQSELSYVAASAVFPSQHKNNLKTIWGLDGLTKLCQKSNHPVVGIGGIDETNLSQILQAGARGVAVIGALHQAENPSKMALKLRQILDTGVSR